MGSHGQGERGCLVGKDPGIGGMWRAEDSAGVGLARPSGKPWGRWQDGRGQTEGRSPRWVGGQGAWPDWGVAGSRPEKGLKGKGVQASELGEGRGGRRHRVKRHFQAFNLGEVTPCRGSVGHKAGPGSGGLCRVARGSSTRGRSPSFFAFTVSSALKGKMYGL